MTEGKRLSSLSYWKKVYKRYEDKGNSYIAQISRRQAKQRINELKRGLQRAQIKL